MKRTIRILALLICAVLLCVSLCSCEYLDDLKNNRAILIDGESFTFHGQVYRLMPLSSKLTFIMSNPVYSEYYLTTEDVPVLLSPSYGDRLMYNFDDGEHPAVISVTDSYHGVDVAPFLTPRVVAAMSDDLDSYADSYINPQTKFYVREDRYDDVKKSVDNVSLDHFYITVYQYNDDGEEGRYIISAEVFGNGIDMWIRSQGNDVKEL